MIGYHAIIRVETKNANKMSDVKTISKLIESISDDLGTTIIESSYHEFGSSGLTGFTLLKESHIALHTWPEYNFLICDILSCKKFGVDINEKLTTFFENAFDILNLAIRLDEI